MVLGRLKKKIQDLIENITKMMIVIATSMLLNPHLVLRRVHQADTAFIERQIQEVLE